MMKANAPLTPDDAPILCLVCTSTACGSQLIATVNVRLNTRLTNVRHLLVSLASGGDGGDVAVHEAPVNVDATQAHQIVSSPLHPFDFTETFSFVHGGGAQAYSAVQESALKVVDVLPRYMRFGIPPAAVPESAHVADFTTAGSASLRLTEMRGGTATTQTCSSSCTRWLPHALPPVAIVRHPRQRRHRRATHTGDEDKQQQHDLMMMGQKRLALAALFVAPGDRAEGGLRAERVVAERLRLQLPDPQYPLGALGSGAGLLSATALAAGYGRPFRAETWAAGITRWNGNVEDLLGRTMLHEAAQVGNEAAVRLLLALPYIEVDVPMRQSGDTALHRAVRFNHPTVVKQLLEEGGANVLRPNHAGNTPLHLALMKRQPLLVGMLCARLRTLQVPPSALEVDEMRNESGQNPADLFALSSPSLMELCRHGPTLLAIKALVHHYFFKDTQWVERDAATGQSVLHVAAAGGSVDVLRYLEEERQFFARLLPPSDASSSISSSFLYDRRRQNPLHIAVTTADPACVQYLLQKLPVSCLTDTDVNGDTPLLLCAKMRRWTMVELLLAQCPAGTLAVSSPDRCGFAALHFACGMGMTRVAAMLLQYHGASCTQSTLAGPPPLSPAPATRSPLPPSGFLESDDRGTSAPAASTALWGPHWENTTLVRHDRVGGRLQKLEAREAKRQERRWQRADALPGIGTALAPRGSASAAAGGLPDYTDASAIAKATPHYVYGGGRLGYTPLRCALLRATRSGLTAVPMELLRLLCEHGAVNEYTPADTRDLLFFLLTHRADTNAEAMLGWLLQNCSSAVAVLSRDNVLLCRLCALHHDVGVRWCTEAGMCDVQARSVNPLVACAVAGDAAAAAFLIYCAGAEVNALAGPRSALAVALQERQVEVAQVLLLSGAKLSSGDGSWSALQQAATCNLTEVVRGLLGTDRVSAAEVSQVLLCTLQSLLYTAPSATAQRSQLATFLATAYDPTQSVIHPTELLHLSAAVGCFTATKAITDRLLTLPSAIWAELLASVPAAPSRTAKQMEPTLVPVKHRSRRLLPNPHTGKGGLYRPPRPFQRLVLPSLREARAPDFLLHRAKVRDVYSYAVAAHEVELVQTLRCGLRLLPWPRPDVRGWTVMDYVADYAATRRTPLLAMFVATGIAPARRHGRRIQPIGDHQLLRALYDAQQRQKSREGPVSDEEAVTTSLALTAGVLASLMRATTDRRLAIMREILDAFLDVNHLSSFEGVPSLWLAPVVRSAADAGRLDALTALQEVYRVDLSQDWNAAGADGASSPPATPLLQAVHRGHVEVVRYMLRAGCAVHARSCPSPDMAAHVHLKHSVTATVTPLCLVAWKQDVVLLRLLLSAAPQLQPEDTEETLGVTHGDALRGLVFGARFRTLSPTQEAAVADGVRALALAGHPLRFSGTLRVAAAASLFVVAEQLVESYGGAALQVELAAAVSSMEEGDTDEEAKAEDAMAGGAGGMEAVFRRPVQRHHLTALAYFAARPRLVPVLRSLLVECSTDEYKLEGWRRTSLSEHLQSLYHDGNRPGVRLTSAAVDYALRCGCAEGAMLLLALGLMGRGVAPLPSVLTTQRSREACSCAAQGLCARLSTVLQLWHRRQRWYASYTVLHSAAELGYGDVVGAITAEVQELHLPAFREAGAGESSSALSVPSPAATMTAPSLYALAATHADGWAWLPYLERVELVIDPRALYVAPRDVFALIFSGFGISAAMDQVCRRAARHKLLGDAFSVFEAGDESKQTIDGDRGGAEGCGSSITRGNAVTSIFTTRQLQEHRRSLYVAGGAYVLTGMTSLTCAIAAGRFDWVQYLSVHGPSLAYHRATATRLSSGAERRTTQRKRDKEETGASARRPWRQRDAAACRPRRLTHHCSGASAVGPTNVTEEVCHMDALTLCVLMLAEASLQDATGAAVRNYEEMLRFLLSWPAAMARKETVNLLAVVVASLRRWPLLLFLMERADRLYSTENDGDEEGAARQDPRYFFPLLLDEIPPVLSRVIGSARHVMHVIAAVAPKEVLIEVARRCQRADVESAVDARGCTSVYHALLHPQPYSMETFAALRVPLAAPCRTKQRQTPLMVAAAHGRTSLVTSLLRPDRVNQQDRDGRTALMLAAAHGHRSATEVLLAANADTTICDAQGRTAAMLAALYGYDVLAVQLVQHFSHPSDLVSAETSVLHCAAVGGCWRTLAAAARVAVPQEITSIGRRGEASALVALREDVDGHTPLLLAHFFGRARALRELLRILYQLGGDGEAGTLQCLLADHCTGAVERQILLSDSALPRHGWLAGVMELNAALETKVRLAYALNPATKDVKLGEVPYVPYAPSLRQGNSLLRWCVQTRNTVGLRVLADFNVADDCDALSLAAVNGASGVVELLVELEMSDPSVPDSKTGRLPFELAAVQGHTACAAYLLAKTVFDLPMILGEEEPAESSYLGEEKSSAENPVTGSMTMFHLMAAHCGGELLVQFVEQTARTNTTFVTRSGSGARNGLEGVGVALYRALQRHAGSARLTPLEYAVALGDAAAVLRTAQVLQYLQSAADAADFGNAALLAGVRYDQVHELSRARASGGLQGEEGQVVVALDMAAPGAVFLSAEFLRWVPVLGPAVRTVLFDVFGMVEVSAVAGFDKGASSSLSRGRARFGDVRLVGLSTLHHDDYCADVLQRFLNPDHEREVLQMLLRDFPYKIRYEPESFKASGMARQTALLQWLGTTLVLGAYDAPAPCGIPAVSWAAVAQAQAVKSDFETIELRVVRHRSEQFVELAGTALTHSVYISTAHHALVEPEVMTALPRGLRAHREGWRQELARRCEQATALLRRVHHPVLQSSVVSVEWDLLTVAETVSSVATDVAQWGGVFTRVCEAMRSFEDWVRGPLHSLVAEVDASDLTAVVAGVRHGAAAGVEVIFRYVSTERPVTRFPESGAAASAVSFRGDVYPSCAIEFNDVTHTDVAYACEDSLGRAVAGDVALVRVHHARDRFLRTVQASMATPRGVVIVDGAAASPTRTEMREASSASLAGASVAGASTMLNESAAVPSTVEPLRFKLELEGATLDRMPVYLLERLLLEETVAALEAVVSPCPPPTPSPTTDAAASSSSSVSPSASLSHSKRRPGQVKTYDVFHSAAMLSAALIRRLRSVLVLFTTRRESLVKLSGDKLMLCFTPDSIPSRSEIVAELTDVLVQEECDRYRRRLAEVYDMMQQRLTAYLPQAHLTIDLGAVEQLAGDKAHTLAAMRLLVHQQSAWVLQRLVEGVSIGWDTELGSLVRQHVTQVTVTLEPGLYGSCYLSPSGVFVYYCPLLCLERRPAGPLLPSSLPSWQLLSAQHIASMLLLQLAVLEPTVPRFVDMRRSVACWTVARCIPRMVLPGSSMVVEARMYNLLRRPIHSGGEYMKLMGEVTSAQVEERAGSKGTYIIRFKAPPRAGAHRLFILLHGQPIADSPLYYYVRPGLVALRSTRVMTDFDAVVTTVPFTALLQLRDAAGNRVVKPPHDLDVKTSLAPSTVEVRGWRQQSACDIAVTLCVAKSVPIGTSLSIPLTLSIAAVAGSKSTAASPAASATITLSPLLCVDVERYQHVCLLRQGLSLEQGSPTERQAPRRLSVSRAGRISTTSTATCLYFRKSVRDGVRRRLSSEASVLGGALSRRFPHQAPTLALTRPALPKGSKRTKRGGGGKVKKAGSQS